MLEMSRIKRFALRITPTNPTFRPKEGTFAGSTEYRRESPNRQKPTTRETSRTLGGTGPGMSRGALLGFYFR
jgi:hypothetical protein